MSPSIHTFKNLDAFMTSELLDFVDRDVSLSLFDLVMKDDVSGLDLASSISDVLESLDWDAHSTEIGKLINYLLPIEELVPEVYSEWRPIVRESVAYIVSHLSPPRIIPKLVNQIIEPDKPLEQRLISFIKEMPTLQKLGQVIARNRNLNPEFRDQLMRLENSIRDVNPIVILELIHERLGKRLAELDVHIDSVVHSEATVAAVVRFSYRNPEVEGRMQGVFKVLKPGISANFWEEISMLNGLVDHIDERCQGSVFQYADFHEIVDEIREHLTPELDLRNEQRHLSEAAVRYDNVSGVRIPKLIPALCDDSITAMSFERGCKVTEAYNDDQSRRLALARSIIEVMVAVPLFGSGGSTVLHADPHAGNLLVDEEPGELVILDWALVDELSAEDRRQIVMLVSAFLLRDELMALGAIVRLCECPIDGETETIVKKLIQKSIEKLPLFSIPTIDDVMGLIDDIALRGIRFSSALLVFRKVLMTIEGLLQDLAGDPGLDPVLAQYLGKELVEELIGLSSNRFPLSSTDGLSLLCSAQWLGFRMQLNAMKKMFGEN